MLTTLQHSALHVLLCCLAAGAALGEGANSREAVHVLLSGHADAVCLDGSPGAYFFRNASDETKTRSWVIFLEGGGECVSDKSCIKRRSTPLGSTRKDPASVKKLPKLVSDDPAENPFSFGWNHVYIRYCSGDLHLGQMTHTASPQWGWARFAGHHIIKSVLMDLVAMAGFGSAKEIIWTGESAGGIGSFAHLDFVADLMKDARVVGAPIAGYYWNNAFPYEGPGHAPFIPFDANAFKAYYELYDAFVPKRCAEGPYKRNPWVCALADFSFSTTVSDVFVSEAQIDYIQLKLHTGVACDPRSPNYGKQQEYCLHWGRNMSAHLDKVAESAKLRPAHVGIFSPACRLHTEFSNREPKVDSLTYVEALGEFVSRSKEATAIVKRDDCCSGESIQFNPSCPSIPSIPQSQSLYDEIPMRSIGSSDANAEEGELLLV